MLHTYKKNLMILIGIILLFGFIYQIKSILLPFILAFVLAYFLHPCVMRLEGRYINRTFSTLIVTSLFCILVVGSILILVPLLQTQILDIAAKIPSFIRYLWHLMEHMIIYTKQKMTPEQTAQLSDWVSQNAFTFLNSLGQGVLKAFSGGAAVFNILSLLLITPVVLFYILRDWKDVSKEIKMLVPKNKEVFVQNLWSEINRTLSGFIRGQVSVCLALALYYSAALSLIGLESGILVGLLAGLLSFIPYFGFLTGVVLSIVLGLTQETSLVFWLLLALVFGVGQILEGYVLTPRLVGEKVGLSPVWVIFALLVGGSLGGFLGILIAVPVAAVIGVLIRRGIQFYKQSKFYLRKK